MNLSKTYFFKSVMSLNDLPTDQGAEVAFAGRSNVGKSTAINAVTQVKGLARTSKTPGRTQALNYFGITGFESRIVDLPGYGYAKVARECKAQWHHLLDGYFKTRLSLKGLFLLMDIRHPLMPFDKMMLEWSQHAQMAVCILLTKADKFSKSAAKAQLFEVRTGVQNHYQSPFEIHLFSAVSKQGLEIARSQLIHWLQDVQNPID